MSNYRRAVVPGAVLFFTVVTHNRTPIFTNEERVARLREALRKVINAKPFKVDAIVVLPDHMHCIWRLPEGDGDYSGRWREIKKRVSQAIAPETNRRQERPVWQRRFWEHVIRDEQDWRRHMDYIHYNPVKHQLVNSPGDWPWSSYLRYVARGWYDAAWGRSEPKSIEGLELE